MAVLRKRKRNNYTVIDNGIFKNRQMSLKAKGLLCLMLSLPDDWEYSLEGLATLSHDGKDSVRSALSELERLNHFKRVQLIENGKFTGVEYIISEEPMLEKPMSENPISENPPQLNTNTNKELKESNINYEKEFDSLWELYPNKKGKQKALTSYIKARKDGTQYEKVEAGIKAYAEYVRVKQTSKEYMKHGSTFFNQKSWEDDWSTGIPSVPSKPVISAEEVQKRSLTFDEIQKREYEKWEKQQGN